MDWAAQVYDLCLHRGIPFLFKQANSFRSECGINALSLFLAERDGVEVDPGKIIRFPRVSNNPQPFPLIQRIPL
jgi:hypothetical protein